MANHLAWAAFKRRIWVGFFPLSILLSACAPHEIKSDACHHRFTDEEVTSIVKQELHINYEAKYYAHFYQPDCTYRVVIYPYPITPDFHTFVRVDDDGKVIKVDDGPH